MLVEKMLQGLISLAISILAYIFLTRIDTVVHIGQQETGDSSR